MRYGLANAPASGRTIIFDVGGMIALSSTLSVSRPNVTIAGQTAPGIGICLRNDGTGIGAQNIVIRHLRFRPGDANKGPAGFSGDSLSISTSRVIVDHCSASWGIDEGLSSAGSGSYDVTVQYCLVAEGLDQTGLYHGEWNTNYNPGGTSHHSMGSLIKPVDGSGQVTYHHNFWACNYARAPGVGTYYATQVFKTDIRNNVMYNNNQNGYRSAGPSSRIDMNYVGNYLIAGPETYSSWRSRAFDAKADDTNFYIYQSGNLIDTNLNLIRDGVNTGWGMFVGTYNQLASPASMRPVTTHPAGEAYHWVINGAGALSWARDSVDSRLIQNLLNQTGAVIDSQNEVGGYPVLPTDYRPAGWDTDQDGVPDYWELAVGTNPLLANNNHTNSDGYTDLEHYLNWLADLHASGPQNAALDVELWPFTAAMTNATYSVSGATNGTVVLRPDGHTARFTPAAAFYGRASFRFGAVNPAGGGMTNTVALLITPVLPPPRFTSISVNASKVVLNGEGGLPYGRFVLTTSTNLGPAGNNWTTVATNQFDSTGSFRCTNTLLPDAARKFFRLHLP